MGHTSSARTTAAIRPMLAGAAATSLALAIVVAAPAGQAASPATGSRPTRPVATDSLRAARAIERDQALLLTAGLLTAGLQTAGLQTAGLHQTTKRALAGGLTGVVTNPAGRPVAGVCVSAAGPAGATRAVSRGDGRYVLAGLRPGRYALRLTSCRGGSLSASWPGMTGTVTVRAGQIKTLTPATARLGHPWRPGTKQRPVAAALAAKTGSMSGRLTGNGRPLAGICVEVDPFAASGSEYFGTTSRNGRYRITGIAPGRYQVQFAPQLICPNPGNWLTEYYPSQTSPFGPVNPVPVRVRANQVTTGIGGKLKQGGELAGIIRSKSGNRLANICVNLDGNVPGGSVGFEFPSNYDGSFVLNGVFAGQYTAEFGLGCGNQGNYAFQWWRNATSENNATVIKIRGNRIVSNIDPVLGTGATISGVIKGTNSKGNPIARACISAFGADNNDYADTTSGQDGSYRLEGLAAGRYQVVFDPTCGGGQGSNYVPTVRSVSLKAGQALSGVDVFLVLVAGASGVVTDAAGHAAGGVCVLVDDQDENFTVTKPNGDYVVTGVPPGTYTLQFFGGCGNVGSLAPQYYDDQPTPAGAKPVTFLAGKVTPHINEMMRPGGTIGGVITDTAGHRLSGACAGAIAVNQTSPFAGGNGSFAPSKDGRYLIQNLAPGSYQLSLGGRFQAGIGCISGRYATQWYKSQEDETTADFLSVTPGVTTRVNAQVTRPGSIRGRVTDQAGHPLANICVTVVNPVTKAMSPLVQNFAQTGRDGTYLLTGVTPGRYLVQFSDCNNSIRYGTQWYPRRTTTGFATPVTVRAGRVTTGINADLGLGGSISGVVTGPSGKPLRNVCVTASDNGSLSFYIASTDKSGKYRLTALGTGSYQLVFVPCGSKPNLGRVSVPAVRVMAPRAVTGIDVRLSLGGHLSGTIQGKAGGTATLNGACVIALPVDPRDGIGFAFADAKGRYLMPQMAPGAYHVYFGDQFCDLVLIGVPSFAPQWYNDQPTRAQANPVAITAGHTTTASATLVTFGEITGTVTRAGHGGVAGECVTAIPFQAQPDIFTGTLTPPETAITTRTGRYTLLGLTPGDYKIEFSTGCGDSGFATQWWHDASSAGSATPITLRYSAITGIDATLNAVSSRVQ